MHASPWWWCQGAADGTSFPLAGVTYRPAVPLPAVDVHAVLAPVCSGTAPRLIGRAREADGAQRLVRQAQRIAVAELAQHGPGGLQPPPLDEQRVQEQEPCEG